MWLGGDAVGSDGSIGLVFCIRRENVAVVAQLIDITYKDAMYYRHSITDDQESWFWIAV